MRFTFLLQVLLATLVCSTLQASPSYPVPERYKTLFDKAYSGSDYAIEVRSGIAHTQFEVDDRAVVKPSQAFLNSAEASEWTVRNQDSGVTSVNGVTFVYALDPDENKEADMSHSLELLVIQTTPDGRHSSFRVKTGLSEGKWIELVSMDRSQGDVEKYAYIIVRLRDIRSGSDDQAN